MSSVKAKIKLVWLGLGATRSQRIWELLREIIVSVCGGALVFFASLYGNRAYNGLVHVFGRIVTVILIGTIVTSAGFSAHWFKRKRQFAYGRVEIFLGTMSAFAIASTLSPDKPMLAQCVSLIACAYVIARGMGNMSEANTKELAELLGKVRAVAETIASLSSQVHALQPQRQMPSDPN
jgi:uncharacterized membrane protein HdeD (DUF308 family)